jgi:hypothetical protein
MTKVTYMPPNEPGYPASTEWNGVKFHANVPVELDPVKHSYIVLEVQSWLDPQTREKRTQAVEVRKSMADIARTHRHFVVEDDTPPVVAGAVVAEAASTPAPEPAAVASEESLPTVIRSDEPAPTKNLGGHPRIVTRDKIDAEVFRLMNEKGEFCADNPEWNAKARLEEAIAAFCESLTGARPSETTCKDYLKEPLQRWRQGSET